MAVLDLGETLEQAATREVTEETGIELDQLGPQIWIRESRFRYRNRDHHRIDHVFLARRPGTTATVATKPTDNEKLGLINRAWFTTAELHASTDNRRTAPPVGDQLWQALKALPSFTNLSNIHARREIQMPATWNPDRRTLRPFTATCQSANAPCASRPASPTSTKSSPSDDSTATEN